jgi:hypothetical protein
VSFTTLTCKAGPVKREKRETPALLFPESLITRNLRQLLARAEKMATAGGGQCAVPQSQK